MTVKSSTTSKTNEDEEQVTRTAVGNCPAVDVTRRFGPGGLLHNDHRSGRSADTKTGEIVMRSTTGNEHIETPMSPRRDRGLHRRAMPAWRVIAVGAVLGLTWGILARVWMRLVSTVPEFTWSGTLFILCLATVAGTSLATVEALRRRGTGWWRHLLAIPALILFAGQGALMAPTALLGGLALSGRGPRWLRLILAALSLAPIALIVRSEIDLGYSRGVGTLGLALICLALAAAWSTAFRSRDVPLQHEGDSR